MVRRSCLIGLLAWLQLPTASSADAAPMLRFSVNGGAFTVVTDEGAGDTAVGTPGRIVLDPNALASAGYPTASVEGSSQGRLILSVNLLTPPGVNDLRIEFTDSGFSELGPVIMGFGSFGPSLPAGSFVTGSAFYDATPPQPDPFSHETLIDAFCCLSMAPYTLTVDLFFHTTGQGAIGAFEVGGPPVVLGTPEPASMTLLGLGLAGLGVRRWRQRART